MKTNPDFILRDIAGEKVLIPTQEAARGFQGLINMNGTAAFIWEHLDQCASQKELIELLMETYDVDREQAETDVTGLLKELQQFHIVLE